MDRTQHSQKIAAVIVAAGASTRFGTGLPKQYALLEAKPLLRHSIETFLATGINDIIVVIHPNHQASYRQATEGLRILPSVFGGKTRAESVLAGLKALTDIAPHTVLIHDAARPFVDPELIQRVLGGLHTAPGCIPAIPVTDTIKYVESGLSQKTLPRETLWRAQTPQGFHYPVIRACFEKTSDFSFTDEAALLESFHIPVQVVPGSEENVKVTFSIQRGGKGWKRVD
jgi:2-C-methyl-D-erythritol 4-phosphate cytidylyltransferase / 2-C-methyl-D-erythritol 2,4-cyclodiphosphate synthase